MTRALLLRCTLVIALAAVAVLSADAAAETITEIEVIKNSKTTDDTVRFLAGIDEGDDWEESMRDEIKIDLVSSGLFKEVDLYTEPHPKGGIKVVITAKDKHSWIVAPTYYNQPTNKGGGVGYGENNLFGENKKLLLYGQIATGDSFFIGAYVDPSIKGTPFKWQFDVFLRNERVKEYSPPLAFVDDSIQVLREEKMRYFNAGLTMGFTLFRSMSLDGRIRGAHVSYTEPTLGVGAVESQVDSSLPDGCLDDGSCPQGLPKPGAEGIDVSWEGVLKFDRRANWYGIKTGSLIKFSYEQALPQLGSDFDYYYMGGSLQIARKFFSKHNLIWNTHVGWGDDVPFQHEYTSGGTSLRGYKNRQFRGDFKLSQNLEYSVQLFNIKGLALRALIFGDAAYTEFRNTFSSNDECGDDAVDVNGRSFCRHYLPGSLDLDDLGMAMDTGSERWRHLRTSFGVGTRIYIRQIVLPLLGLDLGYSPESGGYEVYFAIGLTDL